MMIKDTKIKGLYVLEPVVYEDNRGWFSETFSAEKLKEKVGEIEFIQDNHSFSKEKYTLRGLHFQNNPKAQSKLVRCTRGEILDVVVDLRKSSTTFLQSFSIILSGENKKQLFVPKGFAHGFLTLESDSEVQYKVDEYYFKDLDRSIRFDDENFKINWGIESPILSKKDLEASYFKESDFNFE